MYMCKHIDTSIYLHTYLSIFRSFFLSFFLSMYLFIEISIYLYIYIDIQSQHCKRIPCIRKSGAGFVSRFDVCGMYMEMETKKLRDPGIFKPKKFGCLQRN